MGGYMRQQVIAVGPLGNGAVGFEAAVHNYRQSVNAFRDNHIGSLERGVRVTLRFRGGWFVPGRRLLFRGLLLGRFHRIGDVGRHAVEWRFFGLESDAALIDFLHHLSGGNLVSGHVLQIVKAERASIRRDIVRRLLRIDNEMRELLVLDFDGANGVAHGGLVNRSDGYNLVSSPIDLAAGLLNNLHSLYAGHLFGFARIDIRDARVGIGRADESAVKHALRVVVVCVFGVASGLCSAIDAPHTAADIGPLI